MTPFRVNCLWSFYFLIQGVIRTQTYSGSDDATLYRNRLWQLIMTARWASIFVRVQFVLKFEPRFQSPVPDSRYNILAAKLKLQLLGTSTWFIVRSRSPFQFAVHQRQKKLSQHRVGSISDSTGGCAGYVELSSLTVFEIMERPRHMYSIINVIKNWLLASKWLGLERQRLGAQDTLEIIGPS